MSKGVILLVSPSFPPMEGGVAMATYEMARDLQCLGWDIHVLTPESGLPPDSSLPDPCSVTRISFVSSHETRHRIDACLEHIHPSLVIFHSWQDWHLDYMAALCRERNIPMIIRSHGCHTDFHSFFRIQYPPFFGIKKWITSFPTIRRNVNKITGHLHLVCLDDHGSLFKGYDYYYAKKRGMPNFTVIPNTFLPLQPSSFSFRKKYHLEHSLLFSCPASASVRKRKQRRIFIFHPGTTASHVVGGHVMRRSLDCSGCRRNLHPPGRHCSEETQYQKSAASLASNDPGKHQENSVAGGQAVLVSPLFSKSCLSAVGNTIQ